MPTEQTTLKIWLGLFSWQSKTKKWTKRILKAPLSTFGRIVHQMCGLVWRAVCFKSNLIRWYMFLFANKKFLFENSLIFICSLVNTLLGQCRDCFFWELRDFCHWQPRFEIWGSTQTETPCPWWNLACPLQVPLYLGIETIAKRNQTKTLWLEEINSSRKVPLPVFTLV